MVSVTAKAPSSGRALLVQRVDGLQPEMRRAAEPTQALH